MDAEVSDARPTLLLIAGPTAVGKTEISLAVAQALNGEIISADSAAVYRGLDLGTAKPTAQERRLVPHHGLDLVDPDQSFSVADFQKCARHAIDDIVRRGRFPVVVGGTGLWLRALIRGYKLPEEAGPSALRAHIEHIGRTQGFDGLRRQLRVVDPASYQAISPRDYRRLVRALEVFVTSGRALARNQPDESLFYRPVYWVLSRSVAELHERIRSRCQTMLQQGLRREVEGLLRAGIRPGAQSLSAIGYREMVDWLYGRLTESERDRLMVRHTQQLAKRQLTWFRSEKEARWIDLSAWPADQAIQKIIASVRTG